jgi:2-methylisocitrate lyase-like PEP mutase family enzyme
MSTQIEKASAFRALHERESAFIIPNPWDVGTARLLAHLGFEALATTSAGHAFSAGQRDNTVARREVMRHLSAIVAATNLPVSADLQNGFGDAQTLSRKPSALRRLQELSAARSKMPRETQTTRSTTRSLQRSECGRLLRWCMLYPLRSP